MQAEAQVHIKRREVKESLREKSNFFPIFLFILFLSHLPHTNLNQRSTLVKQIMIQSPPKVKLGASLLDCCFVVFWACIPNFPNSPVFSVFLLHLAS